ncbi:hypothetical protein FP2_28100 [Faecalibacterium prausnitzii L2-6]|uniref:Uncharacterized protein n=1 Tax=Faecalibacterium prausnitzii L2-6 TaxID=718252 RepID=D4K1E4_9FIRM|nr:hypothetical protein FP2_28100 [Faecalibacterium prausnitzii L2-6]
MPRPLLDRRGGSALALTERLFLRNGKAAAGEKAPAAVPPAMMPVI